jgi:hypothetical protein
MNTAKRTPNENLTSDDKPLARWSKRKQAVLQEKKALEEEKAKALAAREQEAQLPTDEDMPPIESLTPDSDFTGFMSPKVSESLRRMALRKLFLSKDFNICDGLDDYDGDYTSFEKLGSIITADMKHQLEVEAQKKLDAMKDSSNLDDTQEQLSADIDGASDIETDGITNEQVSAHDEADDDDKTDAVESGHQQFYPDDEDDSDGEVMG